MSAISTKTAVRRVLVFGLFAAAVGSWAQIGTSTNGCRAVDVPTSRSIADAFGTIDHNNVTFASVGGSSIELQFMNQLEQPIKRLALVLEYSDADGGVVAKVPLTAQVVPSVPETAPNVFSPTGAWKAPLLSGDSVELVGDLPGVIADRCPARAAVTFASFQFVNGSSRTFAVPEWHMDATLSHIPDNLDVTPPPIREPVSVRGHLRITASGEVIKVTSSEAPSSLLSWIQDRMKSNWKFYPAFLNGHPVPSELPVIFLLSPKGTPIPKAPIQSEPTTVIRFGWSQDLFGPQNRMDRWTVMYGTLTEGTTLSFSLAGFIPQVEEKVGANNP
jgi:hypothetical protein